MLVAVLGLCLVLTRLAAPAFGQNQADKAAPCASPPPNCATLRNAYHDAPGKVPTTQLAQLIECCSVIPPSPQNLNGMVPAEMVIPLLGSRGGWSTLFGH